MSDRVAVMNNGRIEQIGPGEEVYLRPQTTFVARFIGETNLMSGLVQSINGSEALIEVGGLLLRAQAPESVRPGDAVNLSIRPESIEIRSTDDLRCSEDSNVYAARVSDVTFFGSTVRYQMTLHTGDLLDVQRLAGGGLTLAIGDEAMICLRPSSAVVLQDRAPTFKTESLLND
jgi:ABC-type Fe3+/spermidine/putrescine transport system ATPase subunit